MAFCEGLGGFWRGLEGGRGGGGGYLNNTLLADLLGGGGPLAVGVTL